MTIKPESLGLSSADESAVRAVVSEFASTWNRHDMPGMHNLDTEDVEWINITGHHWRGKAMVYRGHDTIHRTMCAKSRVSIESSIIRAIAPDVAIAVSTIKVGPLTIPSGQEIPELKTRGTFILVKHGVTWKIAHFHNTTVDLEAEKNDPVTWDDTGYWPTNNPQ
jgi:uncharacterized protein (TIGR02246 family)